MPDIAAFDFDGTLTAGGSVFGFLAAVAGGEVAERTKERLFEMVLAARDLRSALGISTGGETPKADGWGTRLIGCTK